MTRWSLADVLALATDQSSLTAAQKLAQPRPWSELGATSSLVWGTCQGSGKRPYQVSVQFTGPAFRCSCPSRKFPCKHCLALLLLWVSHDGGVAAVADEAAADFAKDWAAQRAAKSVATAAKATAPVDPEAQAKRRAKREATMTAGLEEFDLWLGDLLRQGLAAARRQDRVFWEVAAARLVDAQVPGLAERVRVFSLDIGTRQDWASRLLTAIGHWHLAAVAWQRKASLSEASRGDLRTLLGWAYQASELTSAEQVNDDWVVLGVSEHLTTQLTVQRTWLHGQNSGRCCVVLEFAAGGAELAVAPVTATVISAALTLQPGHSPQRGRFDGAQHVPTGAQGRVQQLPGVAIGVDAALDMAAETIAANPWTDVVALSLAQVQVQPADEGLRLIDAHGKGLAANAVDPWLAVAVSGGMPVDVFGEWDGARLLLCSVWTPSGAVVV